MMSDALGRVTCEEAFRRLDDFMDRELDSEEMRLIHEHLAICAQCTREFNFEISVVNSVRKRLSRIAAPPGLLARILASLKGPDAPGEVARGT
jgi:anti-sigma factor (TIGR02949 family)